MKNILSILSVGIFALILSACGDSNTVREFKNGEQVQLKTYDSRIITLQRTKHGWIDAAHPENALLIDVFGTFCPPCKKEAPKLFDIANNTPNLSVVALSYAEKASDKKLKDFAQQYNAYYFLSNDAKNADIVDTIAADLNYDQPVQLPFKVLLKNGEYQKIGDKKWLLGLDLHGVLPSAINAANQIKN